MFDWMGRAGFSGSAVFPKQTADHDCPPNETHTHTRTHSHMHAQTPKQFRETVCSGNRFVEKLLGTQTYTLTSLVCDVKQTVRVPNLNANLHAPPLHPGTVRGHSGKLQKSETFGRSPETSTGRLCEAMRLVAMPRKGQKVPTKTL
jgi:hypothetical protein